MGVGALGMLVVLSPSDRAKIRLSLQTLKQIFIGAQASTVLVRLGSW